MSEDREPYDVLDSEAEIHLPDPGWTITFTLEGTTNVSMSLPDQTKQNRRTKLVDACRLCLTEDSKVVNFFVRRCGCHSA